MPTCEVCGFTEFSLSDGLFYCVECGSQSQNLREEVTEATTESTGGFRHEIKKKKIKLTRSDLLDSLDESEVDLADILQAVLKVQCESLGPLGVPENFEMTVRELWFCYSDVKDWRAHKEGEGQMGTILMTVCLLYIALVYTRSKITPLELIRYIEEGSVPYYGLEDVVPQKHMIKFRNQLIPRYGLTMSQLYKQSRQLYLLLPLPPGPPANIGSIVPKLVDHLHLPRCVCGCVLRLMSTVSLDTMGCFRDRGRVGGRGLVPPELTCMAAVFLVLKIVYVLDDVHEFIDNSEDNPADSPDGDDVACDELFLYAWSEWVLVYMEGERRRVNHLLQPLYSRELERLETFARYSEFCRRIVYSSFRVTTKYKVDTSLTTELERSVSSACEAVSRTEKGCSFSSSSLHIRAKIPLKTLLSRRTKEGCLYEPTGPREQVNVSLSTSVQFLLKVCSGAMGTDQDLLLGEILVLERSLQTELMSVETIKKVYKY